jgi:hypothetical protein
LLRDFGAVQTPDVRERYRKIAQHYFELAALQERHSKTLRDGRNHAAPTSTQKQGCL